MLGPIDENRLHRIRRELETEFHKPIPEEEVNRYLPGIAYRRTAVIHLTKLNGTSFQLNPELIETVESTPDTVITMVTGRKYIVRESLDVIKERYIAYKREVARGPHLE